MGTTHGSVPCKRPVSVPTCLAWSRAARCRCRRSRPRPRVLPAGRGGTSPRPRSRIMLIGHIPPRFRPSEGPKADALAARCPRAGAGPARQQTCCQRCYGSKLRATATGTLPRILALVRRALAATSPRFRQSDPKQSLYQITAPERALFVSRESFKREDLG